MVLVRKHNLRVWERKKCDFTVLAGNMIFRFWRKIRIYSFDGKIDFTGSMEKYYIFVLAGKLDFQVLSRNVILYFW